MNYLLFKKMVECNGVQTVTVLLVLNLLIEGGKKSVTENDLFVCSLLILYNQLVRARGK